LFVVAGLGVTYGKTGQIIPAGTPLGLMGFLPAQQIEHSPSISGEEGGAAHLETLYIEVRQQNVPQDPLDWFRTDKDR
jgi:septal ring factor EnvC (AmiA/AmiB activator)